MKIKSQSSDLPAKRWNFREAPFFVEDHKRPGLIKRLKTGMCLFLLVLPSLVSGQKANTIKQILAGTEPDTSKAVLLSTLAEKLSKSDPNQAADYAKAGIRLSRKIDFGRGIFKSSFSVAKVFQIQAKFDSSITYLHVALREAETQKREADQAEVCSFLGHSFMRKSEMDSARFYLDKALVLANETGAVNVEAGIYNNYGNVLLEESNYQKALDNFVMAAKLYDQPLHDDYGQCLALSNIGNVEYLLGNYDQAIDYAQRCLDMAKSGGFNSSIGYSYKLIGRIFRKQKKYDSALLQYKQAKDLYLKLGDLRSSAELMQNIGNIYFDKENYTDALASYKSSLAIAKRISVRTLVAYAYSAIGQGYSAKQQYPVGLFYLDSAVRECKATGNTYLLVSTYEAISQVYENMGDYQKALNVHKTFTQLKDSIAEAENRKLTEETQAKFELEKKETQIALLKNDQYIKSLAFERQRAIQIGVAIAFFLTIVIAVLVIGWIRAKNKARRFAEMDQLRNTIARDLHDDIGSTLSTINIASSLAMRGNSHDNSLHLSRIADQSSKMMERMSDIVWSINPINDSLEKVMAKIKEFSNEILEPKNVAVRFYGEESLRDLSIDVEKRKNLFLIAKEAVNNTAKYSEANLVEITLKHSGGNVILIVSDNGKGFTRDTIRTGNGLGNLKARAQAIHAHLTLTSAENTGTRIELILPIT